jgi:hypothetical protein
MQKAVASVLIMRIVHDVAITELVINSRKSADAPLVAANKKVFFNPDARLTIVNVPRISAPKPMIRPGQKAA